MARTILGNQLLRQSLAKRNLIDSSTLADFLRIQKDKEATVTYGGSDYSIIDVVVAPEGVILLTDQDDKPMKASSIVRELTENHAEGMAVFLDIKGELVPAKTITKDGVKAKQQSLTASQVIADTDMNEVYAAITKTANQESWFSEKDESLGGATALVSTVSDDTIIYVSYDKHHGELQVGFFDNETAEADVYFDSKSILDIGKAIKLAQKRGAKFSSKDEKAFRDHFSKIITGSLAVEADVEVEAEAETEAVDSDAGKVVEVDQEITSAISHANTAMSKIATKVQASFQESDPNFSGTTTLYGSPADDNDDGDLGAVLTYDKSNDALQLEIIEADGTPDVEFSGKAKDVTKAITKAIKDKGFKFASKCVKEFIGAVKAQSEEMAQVSATASSNPTIAKNIVLSKANAKSLARFKIWCKTNKLHCELLELTDELITVTISDLGDHSVEEITKRLEDSVKSVSKSADVQIEEQGEEFVSYTVET